MLASHPAVFVPGFEPLDAAGLTAEQKLRFLEATFSLPAQVDDWALWRSALLPPVPGLRVDRKQLSHPAQLEGKSVAGFKLRPYPLAGVAGSGLLGAGGTEQAAQLAMPGEDCHTGSSVACSDEDPAAGSKASMGGDDGAARSSGGGGHTAMAGLDPAAVRALLHRHNVSVLLTLRRNTLKEALSWYKARKLGVSQFTAWRPGAPAAARGSSSASSSTAGGEGVNVSHAAARKEQASGGDSADGKGRSDGGSAAPAGSRKLLVDITAVLRWLSYTERVNAQLQQAVAFFGRPTLELWYEDFQADALGTAQRAAAFIGVPPAAADGLQPSRKFKKAGPDAIEDWVDNYKARRCWHTSQVLAYSCTALAATLTVAH